MSADLFDVELAANLLSHEDRVRLAAKLVESVAKADAPDVPSSAFAPVAWASVRLNLAVQCMDRLNEDRTTKGVTQ